MSPDLPSLPRGDWSPSGLGGVVCAESKQPGRRLHVFSSSGVFTPYSCPPGGVWSHLPGELWEQWQAQVGHCPGGRREGGAWGHGDRHPWPDVSHRGCGPHGEGPPRLCCGRTVRSTPATRRHAAEREGGAEGPRHRTALGGASERDGHCHPQSPRQGKERHRSPAQERPRRVPDLRACHCRRRACPSLPRAPCRAAPACPVASAPPACLWAR